MKLWLFCGAFLTVFGMAPALAQTDEVDFAANVSRHVLLHELGHALIREFRLPVLGNEETMADAFATVAITQLMREDAPQIIGDRARSWLYEARETPLADQDLKGEHEPDARRAYRALCLLYGADPAEWSYVARWINLGEKRADDCSDTAPDIIESWSRILAPHQKEAEAKGQVIVQYGEAPNTALIQSSGVVEEVAKIMREFAWPNDIILHFDSCGREAAYWSRQERRILLCDEYFARFLRQANAMMN